MPELSLPLSPEEFAALTALAQKTDMSMVGVLRQSLRLYQKVSLEAERGHRMQFVDSAGEPVRQPAMQMPVV